MLRSEGFIFSDLFSNLELDIPQKCFQRYLLGNLSMLTQLLAKHTNTSLLNTALERYTVHDAEENLQRMHLHSLAAAHGHRRTLRKLMTVQEYGKVEKSFRSESLSLREALKETSGIALYPNTIKYYTV